MKGMYSHLLVCIVMQFIANSSPRIGPQHANGFGLITKVHSSCVHV